MQQLIGIETTRYSEFFRCLFAEYSDGVTIEIGSSRYSSGDIPHLLAEWCSNAEISRTQHFRLLRAGVELFGFHDHPRELFAEMSERSFVERLQGEQILRYRVYDHDA
jgi:hypothetical protein